MKSTKNYKTALIAMLLIVGSVFIQTSANAVPVIETCLIQTELLANPGGSTEFVFDFDANGTPGQFTLTSPENRIQDIQTFQDVTLTITEQLPEGWELENIICEGDEGITITEVENGRRFECRTTDTQAKCVFLNVNPNLVAIPTLSTWGMAAAGLALVLAAIYFLRRKPEVKNV